MALPVSPNPQNAEWYSHSGTVWQLITNLNMQFPYDFTIVLLGSFSKEKLRLYLHPHSNVYSSIVSPKWKQPQWPSVCAWLHRPQCMHMTGCCSAIKRQNYWYRQYGWVSRVIVLGDCSQIRHFMISYMTLKMQGHIKDFQGGQC